MSYITRLQKLGFTQREAAVYLANLRLGNARVSSIATEAKLPKSTTLDVLRTLNKRGMVSRYKQKNRYYFAATDPQAIGAWLERRSALFTKILPGLEDLQFSTSVQPSVRFFNDPTSFGTLERDILTHAKTLSILGNVEHIQKHLPARFPAFTKKRLAQKIPARIILEDDADARNFQKKDTKFLSQTRITQTPHPFASTLLLWERHVAFISFSPKMSITIIEDPHVTATLHALFELQWGAAQ